MTIESDYYGNNTKWWVGIVKDKGSSSATVKVRIFGVHHMEDQTNIPNSDLPEALVVYPVTSSKSGGSAVDHNLTADTWVVGIWADGENFQQPIVLGTIDKTSGSGSATKNGSGGVNIPVTPTRLSTAQQRANAKTAFDFLRAKFITEWKKDKDTANIIAASFVGVWSSESNVNPTAFNRAGGGSKIKGQYISGALGIGQWRASRQYDLRQQCGARISTVQCQVEYAWREIGGDKTRYTAGAGRNLQNAGRLNIQQAVRIIIRDYEIPFTAAKAKAAGSRDQAFTNWSRGEGRGYIKKAQNIAQGLIDQYGKTPPEANPSNKIPDGWI